MRRPGEAEGGEKWVRCAGVTRSDWIIINPLCRGVSGIDRTR